MCKIKYTNNVLSLRTMAMAILALVFAATAGFPAAARDARHVQFAQPKQYWREHVPNYRYFNYAAPMRPGLTHVPEVPPDACDLPSTGCESYLSN